MLHSVNFHINKGEIVGFLGANGAGKTTTLKCILGLYQYSGVIKVYGKDISKNHELAGRKISGLIEEPCFYPNMTGMQNLELNLLYYKEVSREGIAQMVTKLNLGQFINLKVKAYSLGMKQRLGIALVLLSDPEVILLDEPMNGLDPDGIKDLRELLIEMAHIGEKAILVSSHILSEMQMLCDRVIFIKNGYKDIENIGEIKVENISFRYGTRKLILEDVNFKIEKNDKIAIVGESGSGKTTLARLLLGFYPYEKGEIYFGGIALSDINREWLRNKISYVSQEPYFFKGTIKENLLFGNSDNYTNDEILNVLKIVQLKDFVLDTPEGINMKLQENALNLSGGQRQRLCLARALLRRPDILILDEATSNLDVITESAITKAIDGLRGMTSIIIAHRLSTIKKCNKIVVLRDGKVAEMGTHENLMIKQGYYYELWKQQL